MTTRAATPVTTRAAIREPRLRATVRRWWLVPVLVAYVGLGLRTEAQFLAVKPLPRFLLQDFRLYERALGDAQNGRDPYAIRDIGAAFLYPPPSLLIVQAFAPIAPLVFQAVVFAAINTVLLSVAISMLAARAGYRSRTVWWWYVLALGFAPYLELLHIGQINVVTLSMLCFALYWESSRPLVAGASLALAIATKVTPAALLGYFAINRNRRNRGVIAGAAVALFALSAITIAAYGIQPFVTYGEAFRALTNEFPLGANSQSFVAKLIQYNWIGGGSAATVQRVLTVYVAVMWMVSAFAAQRTRDTEPLLIVVIFGMTLLPNVLWYHHYVFLLPAVFVWMGWSRLRLPVVLWCIAGLALIQIDRRFTCGLLVHAFGHASILAIVVWQAVQAMNNRGRSRGSGAEASE